MKGIIFYGSNIENAIQKLLEVRSEYERLKINSRQIIAKDYARVEFENGDVWKVCQASGASRGEGCNIAFIERYINEDVVRQIIMPTIKFMPYRAYNYYGCAFDES